MSQDTNARERQLHRREGCVSGYVNPYKSGGEAEGQVQTAPVTRPRDIGRSCHFFQQFGRGSGPLWWTATNGIPCVDSISPVRTQESLPNEPRAASAAPAAGKSRPHSNARGRGRFALRRRLNWRGIILGCRGTLMRHAPLPSAVATGPQSMSGAPPGTRLVALGRLALKLSPSFPCTVSTAINLAPITAATN